MQFPVILFTPGKVTGELVLLLVCFGYDGIGDRFQVGYHTSEVTTSYYQCIQTYQSISSCKISLFGEISSIILHLRESGKQESLYDPRSDRKSTTKIALHILSILHGIL